MPSVSTDVLARFNSSSLITGIAGYYVANEGTQHVIVGTSASNGDTLTELYWKSGQGVKQDVLTTFDVAMGPGGGYYVPQEGTQHVIVWTRVGDIVEVYWKSGQGVKQDTLTSFTTFGGFGVFGAYCVPNEGTQHAFVGTIDSPINPTVGIVTEIYWKSGQGVKQDELARFNGSFSALGAYYVPEEGTQHAIVITPEGNLTELYWKPGQGVKQDVLVPQAGRRAGTAFYSAGDQTQHVVLVSDDGTFTDVHWQSGQGIHQDVLTQLSSIKTINEINVAGYYSANDQKRHVIVATTNDGTVTEIYW
jgi:hypothetical protein